jgi:hypothetical protein
VPVAVHLLTRAQPTPRPFPTLRFLRQATSTAVRRRTIKDRALLAVRAGILAAVVAGLAQPAMRGGGTGANAPIVRAVVVDASVGADVVRDRVAQLTPAAADTVSIRTEQLAPGIARAATWLARRGGRGELVVLSPFRRGDLDETDLAPAGRDVGIRLVKIDVPAAAETRLPAERVGGQLWIPVVTPDADRTAVTWTASSGPTPSPAFVRVLAAPGDRDHVAASLNAASVVGVPVASSHPITIVLPDAPERAATIASAVALDEPWMFDVVDGLRRDPVLAAAAQRLGGTENNPGSFSWVPVARDVNGTRVVEAASGPAAPGRELRLFARTSDPLIVAALAAGVARAESDPRALRRLEPLTLAADDLRRWERPLPATGAPATTPESSAWLGRWFWIAALMLLALEMRIRRTRPAPAQPEVTHARVA